MLKRDCSPHEFDYFRMIGRPQATSKHRRCPIGPFSLIVNPSFGVIIGPISFIALPSSRIIIGLSALYFYLP